MAEIIDIKKLDFDLIQNSSDLSVINLEEKDEFDTLNVRKFLLNDSQTYIKNHLTSLWEVTYEEKIIGFFTVSMNAVEASIVPDTQKVNLMRGKYPAMLLGQMWVDNEFRGRRIAYWICQYVIGLARRVSKRIACSCVVLQTDETKEHIYERARFVKSIKSKNGLTWMYRSIE